MFKKLVDLNVRVVTKHPKYVLITALVLTLIAGFLASSLSLELNWVALAPKGDLAVQEYQEIIDEFPAVSNMLVVVENDDKIEMNEIVEVLTEEFMSLDPYVVSATGEMDKDFLLEYALVVTSDENAELLASMMVDKNIDTFLQMTGMMLESNALDDVTEKALLNLLEHIDDKEALKSFLAGDTVETYADGNMTMITVQPSFDILDLEYLEPGVEAVENVIADVLEAYPDAKIGVTGMHVVARDETVSIESDSSLTTVIALVLILILLYVAFRSFSAPLLAFLPLIIGIVWTIGLSKLFIGRLNMITAFSAAMLLGLGIDYAIHMYTSYIERRACGIDKHNAIEHALSITGPGIITGAMTTAVAFFALNISKLEILSELGTIMGLGIISTLCSVFWVLPALIILKKKESKGKLNGQYNWIGFIATKAHKYKVLVVVLLLMTTVFMGFQARHIEFDMNLMNLEPEGLASIELMEKLVDEYDISADSFSVVVDSLDEVYSKHKAFESIDGVKEVVSVSSFLENNVDIEKRKALISPYQVDIPFRYSSDILLVIDRLDLPEDTKQVLKESMDEASARAFYDNYNEIASIMYDIKTITPDRLPEDYRNQIVSKDGDKYLISIYPDFDIWSNLDTEKGQAFFENIRNVDERMTGTPIFMKVLFDAAGEELLLIGGLLFIVLVTILMIHFRSIKYTFMALIPLTLTLIFTVGTMSLIDLKFNMLNFLAVLLIVGIGIDDGVHILHHYKAGVKRINYLFASVGKAILMTTLTTVLGFGSLMFSSYRGIASLGAVLSLGVMYAFIMTILVLPILIQEEK